MDFLDQTADTHNLQAKQATSEDGQGHSGFIPTSISPLRPTEKVASFVT